MSHTNESLYIPMHNVTFELVMSHMNCYLISSIEHHFKYGQNVCVRVRDCVIVCACVRACVRAGVRVLCVCVCACA